MEEQNPSKPHNRISKRSLLHEFTDEEIQTLGIELAGSHAEIQRLEAAKKRAVKEIESKISLEEEAISNKSQAINSRSEHRTTECREWFHTPNDGMKTIERTDTGFSWTEPMTESDFNLFSELPAEQDQEKENEELDSEMN